MSNSKWANLLTKTWFLGNLLFFRALMYIYRSGSLKGLNWPVLTTLLRLSVFWIYRSANLLAKWKTYSIFFYFLMSNGWPIFLTCSNITAAHSPAILSSKRYYVQEFPLPKLSKQKNIPFIDCPTNFHLLSQLNRNNGKISINILRIKKKILPFLPIRTYYIFHI